MEVAGNAAAIVATVNLAGWAETEVVVALAGGRGGRRAEVAASTNTSA